MQVTVSRVSPVELSLRVALPKARVNTALDQAFNELGKRAQIRGFRKGKVPRPILKQYFGYQVHNEVAQKLINETLPGAMRDQNIEALSTPRVETADDIEIGDEWTYTALLEVRPEIAPLELSALEVTRTLYPVTDADVEKALAARREESATLRTPDPARPAAKGDTATVDTVIVLDGAERPEFSSKGRTVEAGTGRLLKELDAALVGMSVGETREVPVTFPENHRQKELAGQSVTVRLSLNGLQEKVLPELDDEFAKDVGKESLADLRASLRADLEVAARERSDDELREAAVNALVKANPVAVPPTMVNAVLGALRQEFAQMMALGGGKDLPPQIAEMLRDQAEGRARAGLLLSELARVSGIRVTEEDLTARLEEIAKETGKAVQRLRVEYRDSRKRDELAAQVVETKVLEVLLSKVTVTEKTAEPEKTDEAEKPAEAKAE